MLSRNKKLIIFDMDGVLLDSITIHKKAFAMALQEYPIGDFDYVKISGMSTEDALTLLLADHELAVDSDTLVILAQKKRDIAHQLLRQDLRLVDGALNVVQHLARQFQLCLASSASRRNVALLLQHQNLGNYFGVSISREAVKVAKPDPEIYCKALSLTGYQAEQAVVIEDAPMGILAAKNAGIEVIGLMGTCREEELRACQPNYLINNLRELISQLA